MPVNINGVAGAPAQTPQQQQHQHAPQPSVGKQIGFLKTGDTATQAFEEQAAARAAAQEAFGRLWRWFIDKKDIAKPFRITFLDGIVNPQTKLLQNPAWKEHTIKNARGKFENYVCTDHGGAGSEPCPLCLNANGDKPTTVMGFTIIDHRPVTFTKGDRAGTSVPFTRKLLIAKSKTLPLLQLKATKFQSLRGVSMDVMRTSATAPSVGDVFELVEQYGEDELKQTFGKESEPANWDFELNYKTAEELQKLGIAPAIASNTQAGPSADYQGQY